jgi:glycosyltransferase involved in cell wall biosynthesis
MRILIAIGVRREREAGAAGVVLNHAQELQRLGHEVECWFLDDILLRPAGWKRFEAFNFAVALARRIVEQRERFDVVNLHAPWGCVYGLWRQFLRPAASPPYVMTMQGSEERYAAVMRAEQKKGRAWHFSWKNRVWHSLYHQTMYKWSITSCDYGVIANREGWILAQLKYRRDPTRMWFIPNGTEEMFFISRNYEQKPCLRLLYVGTWLDRKGVYYLAEAFSLISSRIPGIRLTVAGCLVDENEIRSQFPTGVRDQVCVLPLIERGKMPDLYADHDIFVFPSLMEGMPLTLLEAMASGMPVVTTNTCGMADVVEDGYNGLLVPPADADSVAACVERLYCSPELRRSLGQAAQTTMYRYTWKQVTKKIEHVLILAAPACDS